jgi:hypothetical protein
MRITDFTELTTPTSNDLLVVVDVVNDITKKLKLSSLPVQTAVTTALATKQDTLVSGTNIKTINSTSVLGSGNIAVQETLVSGTNIKTLNNTSLLGSGNITLTANPSGVSGAIQFSNGSAFASDAANLFWDDTNNRLGIGTNTPSSPLSISSTGGSIFDWSRVSGASGYLVVTNTRSGAGQGTVFGVDQFSFRNSSAVNYIVSEGNRLGINTNNDALTSQLQIKGSGSTSATTSLLVQNSAGTAALTVKDDLSTTFGGNVTTPTLAINGNWQANNNNTIFGSVFNYILNPVNIGGTTQTSSAMLEVRSTTRGFLPPVMTTTQKNAIATPATGLVVYDNTTNKLQCYNGSTWNDLF